MILERWRQVTTRWVLGLLLLTSLGCAVLDLGEPPRDPVPATLPDPTATPSPVPPTATPTSVPPSPTPDPCPARDRDLDPPVLSDDLEANITAIEAYLDQGGGPERVELREEDTVLQGDLTGGGSPEVVFSLVDLTSEQIPPKSHLVVFTCQAGGMRLLYRYEPGDWYGLNLIAVEDLTQDGVADLVFADVSCGAHTCWHTPYVWSWAGDDFVNHVTDALQFPYPDFWITENALDVVSGGIGSVGAGPQRPVTTTLAWDGEQVAIVAEVTGPPTFRYHAFIDGERTFAAEDLDAAAALYERVLQDDVLTAWGASVSPEEEHDALRALAQWRLVILNVAQGDSVAAESRYATLMASPQPLPVRDAVMSLAERFWRAYERDGEVSAACAYAVDNVTAQVVLDFLYGFGYANPVYDAPDLCPHLRMGTR